jgi:hypothetical protein
VVTVLPLTCPYPSPRAPILWDSRGILPTAEHTEEVVGC